MKLRRRRSTRALVLASLALICTIIGTNAIFLYNLRESSLQTTEANLARYSLALAEQADRSFASLDLVLSSVGDYLGRKGVTDAASYQHIMSSQETHLLLKEKITGLPQVDAVTMIDAQGKLINFSRYWPIPDVNVSDRDYFKALKADPNLESFISKPVENRGTGTWNIYIARRLNDPNGKFMGLLLGAMSMQYFENFFGSTSLGVGTSASLVREDGTLLARFPHTETIGNQSSGAGQRALAAGGNIRELSPNDQRMRLRSARMLSNYPALVAVTQTEDSALRSWRGMAELLGAMSLVSTIVVLIAVFVVTRWWKKQEHLTQSAEAANDALLTQNSRFDMALNNMSQGLCFFDGEERLIVCNSRYIEMYGLAPERIRPGITLREIVDLRFEAGSCSTTTKDEYLIWRNAIKVSHKPSDTIAELTNGRIFKICHRPMPGAGWVATHEDITEQRRAENVLAEARVQAERAKQEAEAANLAKSAFFAMMSHEIRTPMNAVLGLATTLLDTNLDAEQRSSIVAIHDAGDGLLEILNDILDFSKLEAGQVSLEQIAFSPNALVHNTLSIIGPRASAKGLAIRGVNDSVLPMALKGDAGRIRQVLLNLVSNAVKFTEAGEVVVSARCLARDDQRATIEWAVSDTGIGIAPEKIGILFENFVQADNSISRRFGGSGLGLSICKRLVEQMGGEIKVVSTLGQGSTFRFDLTLPVAEQVTLPERDDQTIYAELKARIAALGRPLRVLIVDDNATNRLVAAKMLKEFEIQNNMACDGAEAVTAACRFSYDVILMDVRMPEMDGLQATRAIRARGGQLEAVPIIGFTASAFAEDVKACRESGMNDFVAKPARKKVMVEAILRVLSSHAPSAEAVPAEIAPPVVPSETPPIDTPSPVDRKAFDNLVHEIGEESAYETIALFVKETEARLKLLRKLSSDADRSTIEREAHSLKGTAGTFGLREVAQLARELERDAAQLTSPDYGVLLDRIDAAFSSARTQYPAGGPILA
jgi:signal transduction histidine kinase/DNA-binding response OmpR family regulator